jgi:DNA primase
VVLAYDADAAGQAAAERFYEWEKRYEVDIRVAELPAGTDPGGLAQTDPDALRAAIETAPPFLGFRLARAVSGADLRTPEGRARAAEAGLGVIREHPGDLVRDQYLMQLSDRVRIPADRLRRLLDAPPPRPTEAGGPAGTPPPSGRRGRPGGAPGGPEVEALRVAIHRPEAVADRLHEVLFSSPVALAAYRALSSATTLHDALEAADATDPDAAALLRRLAVEDDDADPDDVLARLAEEAAKRTVADLESTFRSADDPMAYAADLAWLKLTMEELRAERATAVEATGRLVRWLVSRFEVDG